MIYGEWNELVFTCRDAIGTGKLNRFCWIYKTKILRLTQYYNHDGNNWEDTFPPGHHREFRYYSDRSHVYIYNI